MSEPQQGIYGIDLGTTYSVVGYIDETGRAAVSRNSDGQDTTPSVVYFESADNIVVGRIAKEAAGMFPDQVVSLIKREMGDKDWRREFSGTEYTPPSISALILSALAKDAETDTGRPVSEVVITVPAYFGLLEKDATRSAGEIAGLKVIGIVPEPVAAALHYGVTGSADGTTFLVYDLGGGTFDISLITMTDTSVEVIAVGGNHRLGGADWDEKLFHYLLDQLTQQWGDDSARDDEQELQELRNITEQAKKDLSKAENKKIIRRYSGTSASVTVTRQQFDEMTAELLDETIRITRQTLDEAEQRHPGIRERISELLLVGGSSRMPAVAERLRKEFRWEPRLTDPDLAVAKGAALYAAGQTVRFVEAETAAADGTGMEPGTTRPGAGLGYSAPVTDEAVQEVANRTGIDEEKVRSIAGRTVVNVLPKAVGVKLIDTAKPNWEDDPEGASYIEHLIDPQTQLPVSPPRTLEANTVVANQPGVEIEIWEQAGAAPSPDLSANHRVDDAGLIEGLGPFRLPAGSPVNIEIGVDAEGTVKLRAVEPASGKELEMNVRTSVLSAEQVEEAKVNHRGLTIGTS
ncbi:MAG TPA: Hsp70 family protein [Trebonia sp.]|nr:Hsp70 family protein [Trebonia sp.]